MTSASVGVGTRRAGDLGVRGALASVHTVETRGARSVGRCRFYVVLTVSRFTINIGGVGTS